MAFSCESARWRALILRDSSANGHFVYCVKSTGIYCRPNCNARLARRANIVFHDTPSQAEAAGFRPCKRCQPDMDKGVDSAAAAVEKACAILSQEAASYAANEPQQGKEQTLKLKDLAGKVSLTNSYFHKIFRQRTGTTPKKYLDSLLSRKSNNAAQVSHQSTSPSNAGVGSQYTTAIDTSSITASALDHIPALGFGPNELETTSADTHNHLSALDFASVINDKDMDTTHAHMPQRIFEPDQSTVDDDADWPAFNDGFIPGEWMQTTKVAANPVFNMDDLYSTTFDMSGQFFVGDGMPWDGNMNLALDDLQELPSPLIEYRSY